MKNSLELTDEKAQLKKRATEMIETCKMEIRDFNQSESEEFASIKTKIEEINEELRSIEKALSEPEETNTKENIKSNKETMTEFRLLKAINDIANNRNLDEVSSAVVANGTEEMRKAGLSYSGQIQLPVAELRDITVASEGEDVVATNLYDILEPLRAKNVLVKAGAKFITGLVGDVQIPTMHAGQCTWEGETASAKESGQTFSSIKLQPKRLTAYLDLSKQFLVQDSKDAEALLRQDLINAINSKLESTILGSAAGSATQPEGIFYTATPESVTTISDFKGIADLEAKIEDANVIGECTYVMSNKAKAAFRVMPKSTKSTQLVMESGEIDGTPVYNTSNVEGTNVAYGEWSSLVLGQWGSIDVLCDPYSLAKEGKVRLVINAFFDAKVVREGAIVTAKV